MKLSTAASLGIQGVLVLAGRHGAGTITLDEICRAGELPRDYMARVFSRLARAGLVVAVRGKNGGYRLGRDPESISLLEVIEAIDGRLALNLCQHDPPQCEQVGCPVRPVWSRIQQRVSDVLASKSIRALACGSAEAPGGLAPAAQKRGKS